MSIHMYVHVFTESWSMRPPLVLGFRWHPLGCICLYRIGSIKLASPCVCQTSFTMCFVGLMQPMSIVALSQKCCLYMLNMARLLGSIILSRTSIEAWASISLTRLAEFPMNVLTVFWHFRPA